MSSSSAKQEGGSKDANEIEDASTIDTCGEHLPKANGQDGADARRSQYSESWRKFTTARTEEEKEGMIIRGIVTKEDHPRVPMVIGGNDHIDDVISNEHALREVDMVTPDQRIPSPLEPPSRPPAGSSTPPSSYPNSTPSEHHVRH